MNRDWEGAEKYYNLVEQNDSRCIEAIIYSSFSKAASARVGSVTPNSVAIFGVLKRNIGLLDDGYDVSEDIVRRVGTDILSLYGSESTVYKKLIDEVSLEFIQSCLNIADEYEKDNTKDGQPFYEIALNFAETAFKTNFDYMMKIRKKVKPEMVHAVKFVNTTGGDLFFYAPGTSIKKIIPKRSSAIMDFFEDYYEIEIYNNEDMGRLFKIAKLKLRVPNDNAITISWRFGYKTMITHID